MGVLTASHAWSVTLSVVFSSFVVGMLAFVSIMPLTRITTFLVTMSAALAAAVAMNAWQMYVFESSMAAAHTKLSDPRPEKCPDYWTSEFDECKNGVKCLSYFDTTVGDTKDRVYMSPSSTQSQLFVADYGTKDPDEICSLDETRAFPWLDVSNSCSAKTRTV